MRKLSPNIKKSDNHEAFIGKYVLDSISFGMYDSPFMAIREYVQNSTDAIDEYRNRLSSFAEWNGKILIEIDGQKKSIQITDNGIGISQYRAWHVLHDLGKSNKKRSKSRGFRGIGRLGGLGYCNELKFVTKAENEDLVTTSI